MLAARGLIEFNPTWQCCSGWIVASAVYPLGLRQCAFRNKMNGRGPGAPWRSSGEAKGRMVDYKVGDGEGAGWDVVAAGELQC